MTAGERLPFLADVHVPKPFGNALRTDGFDVTAARTAHPPGTSDEELLAWALDRPAVFLTNDRGFAAIHGTMDHAGIVIYSTPSIPPAEFRRGVRRIDRQFTPRTIENTLLWLEEWV